MSHTKLFIIAGAIAVVIVSVFYFDSINGPSGCSKGGTLGALCENMFQSPKQKDETSDWKTYRNDELGFEFQYPSTLSFKEEVQRDNFGSNTSDWWKINFSNSAGPVFSLDVNNPGIGFEGLDTISSETKTINGVSMERDVYGDAATNQIGLIIYSFNSQENNYLFIRQGGPVEDFDKTLTTFKFIDPTDTSDWKTYRNEEYGFELRYPQAWDTNTDLLFKRFPRNENRIFSVEFSEPQYLIESTIPGPAGSFVVEVYRNSPVLSLGDWVEEYQLRTPSGDTLLSEDSSFSLAGVGGRMLRFFSFDSNLIADVVVRSNQIFSLSYYDYDDNDPSADFHQNVYNEIISSFKFIEPSASGTGTLSGKVSIGPICPVEQIDNPCPTPPEAYASREFLVNKDGKTVTSFHADSNGNYSISLAEGTYTVTPAKTGIGFVSKDLPANVTIKSGSTVTLNIDVDTGIR